MLIKLSTLVANYGFFRAVTIRTMNKQLFVLSTLIMMFVGDFNAQQDPLLTHFFYNKMTFNPASTGHEDGFIGTSTYRNQWDKVDGAPNSAAFNIEGNMERFFPGGLGLSFFHDAIGFNRQNNLMLNYSYPIKINAKNEIRFGLGLGMLNFGMKPNWITTNPGTFDKTLPTAFSSTALDLNFGIFYKSERNFYAGFSITHINGEEIKHTTEQSNVTYNQLYPIKRHMYLMGGYKTNLIGPGYIDAQFLLKSEFNFTSIDLNGRYIMDNLGYAGITFRNSDAIAILLGYMPSTIPNFTIGYSYGMTTNKLSNVSKGSHEVLLRYIYYLPTPPLEITRHPRWL